MKIDFDDVNQDIVLFCAFRYALGRHSYVVGSVARVITENWEHMSKSRREFFKREIREYFGMPWYETIINANGIDCMDAEEWEKILKLED